MTRIEHEDESARLILVIDVCEGAEDADRAHEFLEASRCQHVAPF